jgi:hypothetical protein
MKKGLTIKKEYGIILKQVKEGLRTSDNSVGWDLKADIAMQNLERKLNKDEHLFFKIVLEQKSTINTN